MSTRNDRDAQPWSGPWRRYDLVKEFVFAVIAVTVMIAPRVEVRPVRQLALRLKADQGGKIIPSAPVRIAGLHEIGPVGLHLARQRRLR